MQEGKGGEMVEDEEEEERGRERERELQINVSQRWNNYSENIIKLNY